VSLTLRQSALVFFAFAFAYFLSALLRAVTATLAPVFSVELGLAAADLGLLAGAYFLGFAALQLPMGRALDRWGPRRTLLALLAVGVVGCIAFASSRSVGGLIAARVLMGAGMAAGLMAPLTCYRRHFTAEAQLRANSWMLMTGSLGMLASTLPVQWLLPLWGWRGLFWAVALLLVAALVLVAAMVPRDPPASAAGQGKVVEGGEAGYLGIVRHPLFLRLAPLAFFVYGGMIAIQALWAGPWLTRVHGLGAEGAAQGLFGINLAMLLAFLAWGAVMPRLSARGLGAVSLITWGLPLALVLLAVNVLLGAGAGAWHWAAWCVACTFVSLSQPALGQAFAAAQAGRALSAYNLVIFAGVFCIQWGIGLLVDALQRQGLNEADALRTAFGLFWVLSLLSYLWFLRRGPQPAQAS
jgi:predicted MFS family arabinose efflux permease